MGIVKALLTGLEGRDDTFGRSEARSGRKPRRIVDFVIVCRLGLVGGTLFEGGLRRYGWSPAGTIKGLGRKITLHLQ